MISAGWTSADSKTGGRVMIMSGDSTKQSTGSIAILTPASTSTDTSVGVTGTIIMSTGLAANGNSGNVWIGSGDTTAGGKSGSVYITGGKTGAADVGGEIVLSAGETAGTTGGGVQIVSGASDSKSTGAIMLHTQDTVASSAGRSGDIVMSTGTTVNGNVGDIFIGGNTT